MTAVQDSVSGNHCFGCGPENPLGLQIKTHWDGEVGTCTYVPRPEQSAGPTHILYGGTIASIIDCHSVGTAMADFHDREGRPVGSEPPIWCVTGKLTINYLKPTPIDRPVELCARIVKRGERSATVQCTVTSGGEVTAEAEVVAVSVPAHWRA